MGSERTAIAVLVALTASCGDGFGAPTDVAFLSDGTPIVADGYDHGRLALLDASGEVAEEIGEPGGDDGQLDLPHGVAVDAADRIYVADRDNARVQVFSRDGEHLATFEGPEIGRPFALTVVGEVLYVIDGGDQDPERPAGRGVVLTTSGRFLGHFGRPGSGPGQLSEPHDVVVDRRGRVYVAELGARRVQRFVVQLPDP